MLIAGRSVCTRFQFDPGNRDSGFRESREGGEGVALGIRARP